MFPVISNIATSCLSTRSLAVNLADGEDGDHYWKKKKNQDIFLCDQNESKGLSWGLSAQE